MARIGFIGMGKMGAPMAANLAESGPEVKGLDLIPDRTEAAEGVTLAQSIAEAVDGVDVVMTVLPAGPHAQPVYEGGERPSNGVLALAQPGTLLIDASTIDVTVARDISAAATAKDFEMVDAPVSGGVAGAEAATLTFMVGGAVSAFVRAEPILNCMGKTIVHTGGAGSGQAAKICNNLMLGIQMISVVEAFVLAERLGLEADKLFEVSSNSSGQCWSLTKYCPVPGPVPESPANRDYRAGFTVEMMLKDLKLAQAAAESEGIETRLGTAAAALYEQFAGSGKGGLDFSAIIQLVREL